jgi:transmembrane sensor
MYRYFEKFINNSLTAAEEEEFRLLLKNTQNKKTFEIYLRDLRDTYAALQEPNSAQALINIKFHLQPSSKNNSIKIFKTNWLKCVAFILILISISYGGFVITNQSEIRTVNKARQTIFEVKNSNAININFSNGNTIKSSLNQHSMLIEIISKREHF